MVKKETFDGDIDMEQHLTSDQVNPTEPAMFARRNRPGTSAKVSINLKPSFFEKFPLLNSYKPKIFRKVQF